MINFGKKVNLEWGGRQSNSSPISMDSLYLDLLLRGLQNTDGGGLLGLVELELVPQAVDGLLQVFSPEFQHKRL